MGKTKQRTTAHKPSARSTKSKQRSAEPIFVGLDDGTIPHYPSGEDAEKLRKNMAAWSTYITRLSSHPSRVMDADTKFLVARAYLRRGVAHVQLQEWQQAKRDLDEVIALDVGRAENNTAHWYRALAHDLLDQDSQAIEDWTSILTVIEQVPAQVRAELPREWPPHAYACRARLYCKNGTYKDAIADCDRALALDPKCAEAYSIRGTAYKFTQKFDAALADCTKAIELTNGAVHYYRRALVYTQQGNYCQAVDDLDQALAREPDRVQYQNARTDALMLWLSRLGV